MGAILISELELLILLRGLNQINFDQINCEFSFITLKLMILCEKIIICLNQIEFGLINVEFY